MKSQNCTLPLLGSVTQEYRKTYVPFVYSSVMYAPLGTRLCSSGSGPGQAGQAFTVLCT